MNRFCLIIFLASLSLLQPALANDFVRAKGDSLVIGENEEAFNIKGVCFDNYFYFKNPERILNSGHHSSIDFQRVKEIGMNTIRFSMNHKVFNTEAGFEWLAKNIEDAKDQDLKLILVMHIPPGGFQGGSKKGRKLWNRRKNKKRLIELWQEIARRHSDDPAILGYSLMNEPTPVKGLRQWQNFANKITKAIRDIDQNHMIVIEESYNRRDENTNNRFFILDDPNALYDMHFYEPFQYTHQGINVEGDFDPQLKDQITYPNEELNKDFLRAELENRISFLEENNVPIIVAEFGTNVRSFEDGKGGLSWVSDVIDLFNEKNIGYTFYAYHGVSFAINTISPIDFDFDELPGVDPEKINQPLIDLLSQHQ